MTNQSYAKFNKSKQRRNKHRSTVTDRGMIRRVLSEGIEDMGANLWEDEPEVADCAAIMRLFASATYATPWLMPKVFWL